jgi:hypothetical protein
MHARDLPHPAAITLLPLSQSSGYVEFDTAGQSNMYPVITRAYETGDHDQQLL